MSSSPMTPDERVKKQEQAASDEFVLFDMPSLAHFSEKGLAVQVLSDTGAARMVLFTFRAGQHLKDHRTSSQIFIQALSGHITCTVAGRDVEVQAGMVLQIKAHTAHSVLAPVDAVMLLTMTPSPSSRQQDLDYDAAQG